jgi:hypothetical protein
VPLSPPPPPPYLPSSLPPSSPYKWPTILQGEYTNFLRGVQLGDPRYARQPLAYLVKPWRRAYGSSQLATIRPEVEQCGRLHDRATCEHAGQLLSTVEPSSFEKESESMRGTALNDRLQTDELDQLVYALRGIQRVDPRSAGKSYPEIARAWLPALADVGAWPNRGRSRESLVQCGRPDSVQSDFKACADAKADVARMRPEQYDRQYWNNSYDDVIALLQDVATPSPPALSLSSPLVTVASPSATLSPPLSPSSPSSSTPTLSPVSPPAQAVRRFVAPRR